MSDERLARLCTSIDRAAQCYYYKTPIITDDQFDALLRQLRMLCPDDERLTRVGYPVPPDSMLKKFKHTTFTGSLDKCDDEIDLQRWYKKAGGGDVVAALKADGNSLILYYEDGRLVRAVTRGGDDGVGEDVTANALRSRGVPSVLPERLTCAVRGESILPVESWLQVDPDKDGNPRNIGSGMLRRVGGAGAELLDFVAFDLDIQPTEIMMTFSTETEKLSVLSNMGFSVIPHVRYPDLERCLCFYEQIRDTRDTLAYWIDGIVFKLNDVSAQLLLGYHNSRPRSSTVLKFPAEGCGTPVVDLLITMGHSGALIPTAKLQPCRIGGTTVSSALMNNFEEIEELDLAIGDTVRVVKAKDIIPKLVEVLERPDGRQPIQAPVACPFCSGPVGKRVLTKKVRGDSGHGGEHDIEYGRVIECKNSSCPGRIRAKINTWITKLDIQGIGDGVLDSMIAAFSMRTPADLYRLSANPEALSKLKVGKGKLGAARAKSICANISAKTELPLDLFLGSLGVPYLGRRRVQLIRQAVPGQFDNLDDWRGDKLLLYAEQASIPNTATDIKHGIDDASKIIDDLLTCVRVGASNGTVQKEGQLSFVLTGAMSKPRKDVEAAITAAGHTVKDAMSKGVSYLVQARSDSTSTKSKKAEQLGIQVISEQELYDLLK